MHVGKATDLKVRDAKIEEIARYTLSDRGCGLGLLPTREYQLHSK